MSPSQLVTADPRSLGFDAGRLAVLDRHFERYVDDGRLPGFHLAVMRSGQVVHHASAGLADVEAATPIGDGTLFRLYSMTKPITSVAAMALWERGEFELTDPISRWLPEFAAPQVYLGGPASKPVTRPAATAITPWHLLTHTAGLTYGFHRTHVLDEIYRNAGFDLTMPRGLDLAGISELLGTLPLAFDPGAEWLYSMSTDVLGRLIEVVAGKPLDEVIDDLVLRPLGMHDTAFSVPENKVDRLAALYLLTPGTATTTRADFLGDGAKRRPRFLSGGAGLVSTTWDYLRFCSMLLGGGSLDGVRVLAPRTLAMMLSNHLPGGADLAAFGRPLYAEVSYAGVGFGLGFAITTDPVATKTAGSHGEATWGGMASTAFWIDPSADLAVTFMTQLIPSSAYPLRTQLRQLVYSALVD